MAAPLPSSLKAAIIDQLGWTPRSWASIRGGYTPAARFLVEAGADRAFVKVATTSGTADHMRREIAVYLALGDNDFRPRLLGACADGDHPFLIIEDLAGASWPPPWTDDRIRAVLDTMAAVHTSRTRLRP